MSDTSILAELEKYDPDIEWIVGQWSIYAEYDGVHWDVSDKSKR